MINRKPSDKQGIRWNVVLPIIVIVLACVLALIACLMVRIAAAPLATPAPAAPVAVGGDLSALLLLGSCLWLPFLALVLLLVLCLCTGGGPCTSFKRLKGFLQLLPNLSKIFMAAAQALHTAASAIDKANGVLKPSGPAKTAALEAERMLRAVQVPTLELSTDSFWNALRTSGIPGVPQDPPPDFPNFRVLKIESLSTQTDPFGRLIDNVKRVGDDVEDKAEDLSRNLEEAAKQFDEIGTTLAQFGL